MERGLAGVGLALCLGALGCDDHVISPGVVITEDGFCGVTQVLDQSCATSGCHDAVSRGGSLDLETDPYGDLVEGASPSFGDAYVVPGDPDGSFLYQKVAGTQGEKGSRMPIGGVLSEQSVELVGQWIADGAEDCGGAP